MKHTLSLLLGATCLLVPPTTSAATKLEEMVNQLRNRQPTLTLASAPPQLAAAPANQLKFSTGEVVLGRITAIQGGVVSFSAFRSQNIKADLADLIDAKGENTLHISLQDGTTLQGHFQANGDNASLQVQTEVGSVTVPKSSIVRVATPAVIAAEIAALKEKGTVRLKKYWKGYGDLGYSSSTGNIDTSNTKLQMEVTRSTAVDKFRLNIFTQQADANGSKTVSKTYGEARMDVFMKNNMFYFMQGRLETDDIRNLDLRTAIGAGLGSKLVKRKDLILSLGVGYSFLREAFNSGASLSQGTLLVTLDTDWDINDRLSFEQRISANPDFSRNDLLVKSQSTLKSKLTDDLSFTLGYIYNYDKIPPTGANRRDATITSGIRKDF
jgi:putative salt-induced outer membrane protein YdiY